jgi:CRISPR/Cas system CSM-associated protein Csm3 (group 7 of RAMP superfamily)
MVQLSTLMPNSYRTIELTALIDTALCVGAGGSSGSLADKPIVRTAEGKLLIPGSQLKGRLRHECEKLLRGLKWPICESPNPQMMCPQRANSDDEEGFHREEYKVNDDESYHCLVCQIFGNPTLRSRILVDDLICPEDPQNLPEVLRPGVTINRRRQTAEEKKLFFLETSAMNVKLPFKGFIYLEPNCPTYANILLLSAIKHIHALGGSKSAGLGWLTWEVTGEKENIDQKVWNFLAQESLS